MERSEFCGLADILELVSTAIEPAKVKSRLPGLVEQQSRLGEGENANTAGRRAYVLRHGNGIARNSKSPEVESLRHQDIAAHVDEVSAEIVGLAIGIH
jgi:hypothetical protein